MQVEAQAKKLVYELLYYASMQQEPVTAMHQNDDGP